MPRRTSREERERKEMYERKENEKKFVKMKWKRKGRNLRKERESGEM